MNRSQPARALFAVCLLAAFVPTATYAQKTRTCSFYGFLHQATVVGTYGDDVITGTRGDDVITGTPEGDVIMGLGGNDIIRGRDGSDTICAGRGHDIVRGGYDEDFIRGGRGNDRLFGQQDDWDALNGGPGNDYLDGGDLRGRDEVVYESAAQGVNIDLVAGVAKGDGTDTLVNIGSVVGSRFNDVVYVGPSAPQLYELVAGDGSDTLTIARGVTYPDGGYGDDTYNILEGAAWDEMDDRAGHDIYNICNNAVARDWAPSQDLDDDYEVHFC